MPFFVFALTQSAPEWHTLPPIMWPPPLIYLRLAVPLLIAGLVILDVGNLKRIYADKENLYISNYLKEIVVSISKIQSIEEYPDVTRIYFSEATAFGTAVKFMPKDKFPPWRRSVAVSELRRLADLAER